MGGKSKADSSIHCMEQKSSHRVLIEVQRVAECTYQAETVIGSSFTQSVASLISLPSGTVNSTVDFHMMPVKADHATI